jgi:hypothetical protein
MKKTLSAAIALFLSFGAWAVPLEFDKFIKLETGMNEGQVLQIAGAPDYVTVESHYPVTVKSYYYLGDREVPFTTRIIFSGGTVFSIERDKVFY